MIRQAAKIFSFLFNVCKVKKKNRRSEAVSAFPFLTYVPHHITRHQHAIGTAALQIVTMENNNE